MTKNLYDKGLDAWRSCIDLLNKKTKITPTIDQSQRMVDIEISQTSGSALLTGVDTHNMQCKVDGKVLGESESIELSARSKSLRCTRSSKLTQFYEQRAEYFPPANVKVKTDTGDMRVEFQEMIDGPAKNRLERIEAQLATASSRRLRCEVYESTTQPSAVDTLTATAIVPESFPSEDGWVVTGGGCSASVIVASSRYHISKSEMTQDRRGWFCESIFQANHGGTRTLKAQVRFCKVESP
ncbi:hypothetical protein [Parahaliea mediterranea]|uniref:hypothetical protein n=1 Tax=Parahaliea mediterranea TaxID=651086 RepID=UPI000E2F423D|nr:hypothetical protein [Parahaliea mediterranea]